MEHATLGSDYIETYDLGEEIALVLRMLFYKILLNIILKFTL